MNVEDMSREQLEEAVIEQNSQLRVQRMVIEKHKETIFDLGVQVENLGDRLVTTRSSLRTLLSSLK